MSRLAEDFFLLDEFLTALGGKRLRNWCTSWGKYLLGDQDLQEISEIADENQRTDKLVEKVSPLMAPLLAFFGALCHALQEGENRLTATDAYWLGLIDEVIGDRGLMSPRAIEEYVPDKGEKPDGEKGAAATPQTGAPGVETS